MLLEITSSIATLDERTQNIEQDLTEMKSQVESNTTTLAEQRGFKKHLMWFIGLGAGLLGAIATYLKLKGN